MSRRIGFDRVVRLAWMESVVWGLHNGGDEALLRRLLMEETLLEALPRYETRRKTSTVMMRAAVRVKPEHASLRDQGIALLPHIESQEVKAICWGLLCMSFPIVAETAAIIGHLCSLEGSAASRSVQRHISAKWGERGSLESSVSRIIQTMEQWSFISFDARRRTISATAPVDLGPLASQWLASLVLTISEYPLLPMEKIIDAPFLFPFTLDLDAQTLRSGDFSMQILDGRKEYYGLRTRL